MDDMIYLDNAATTFPKPESVYHSMDEANRRLSVNAGRGTYARGQEAAGLYGALRQELLKLVNGENEAELVLTPSATIAMNQIIGGLSIEEDAVVYVSPFEHNAVIRSLHLICPKVRMEELPLQEDFLTIDTDRMEYMFSIKPPTHVFLTHVSNVTGYILPVERVLDVSKKYHAVTIVDASQSLGLLPLDVGRLQMDYLVFAGHKTLYGPFGIGGFFIRKGNHIQPYLAGGTGSDSLNPAMPEILPGRFEPGSPNITAAAGLLAALKELKQSGGGSYFAAVEHNHQTESRNIRKWAASISRIAGIRLYLPPEESHIGMVSFNVCGYKASEVGVILDEDYQIAVRTGYHCAPLIHKALKDEDYAGTVRAGIGRFTRQEDWEALEHAVREIAMDG